MNLLQRKRNRLADYDYSENGAYFVTICTQNRVQCLSSIRSVGIETILTLSKAGQIVERYINEILHKYPSVSVEHYVIMPNHVHLLVFLNRCGGTGDPSPTADTGNGGTGDPSPTADTGNGGTGDPSPTADTGNGGTGDPSPTADTGNGGTGDPSPTADTGNGGTGDPSPTLGNVIGWFKYQTTKAINDGMRRQPGPFWQRSYYDHVIRDKDDFLVRWNYIDGNPSRWAEDEYHT